MNLNEKHTATEGFSKKQKKIELEKIRKIIKSDSEKEIDALIDILDIRIKAYFNKKLETHNGRVC